MYILNDISLASHGLVSPTKTGYCLAPYPLASHGIILPEGQLPSEDKLADSTSRYAEPFDRGYWLWKYGRKVDKEPAKVDKPEPKRPNLMPQLVAEDLALSQLEAVQLRAAETERDIRELQAYIAEVTLGIETGLAAQLAAKELNEQRQAEMMARLAENLAAARESLLLAMEDQRRHQNQLAAIETVIRYYF